ncbi:MAG: hypothetical protein M3264_04145 [Thermoproteota archaeon]|nr:hypothetical protein [Thermoproteota archaeon]
MKTASDGLPSAAFVIVKIWTIAFGSYSIFSNEVVIAVVSALCINTELSRHRLQYG